MRLHSRLILRFWRYYLKKASSVKVSAKKILTKNSSENVLELPNTEKFFLEAVICHQGQRASGGHYVSYIRDDGSWLLCDDVNFYKVDHSCSSDSYIFIYRKQLDFEPTYDWQEVQECQVIPPGCVVNIDMETGHPRGGCVVNMDMETWHPMGFLGCYSGTGPTWWPNIT